MREALHIFKKDSRGLRVPIALVLTWTVLFLYGSVTTLAVYDLQAGWSVGFAYMLLGYAPYVLGAGWVYLIAQVVHADAPYGDRHFWLTRPHRRSSLLLAKVLFVAAYVAVPLAVAHAIMLLVTGFPVASTLPSLLALEVGLFAFVVIPLLALSSTTSSVGWVIAMIAPIPVLASAFVQMTRGLGSLDWVPFSATALLFVGTAALILWVQFRLRRTRLSQLLLLLSVGSGFAIAGGVSWEGAFAAQQVVDGRRPAGLSASLLPPRRTASSVGLLDGQFQLTFRFEGLPADTLISCEASRISLVSASGHRFDQPVRRVATGRLTRLADGCTHFLVLPREAWPLIEAPVSIESSLYVTTFNAPAETALPIGQRQVVPNYGICVATARELEVSSGTGERLRYTEVSCDTAFRPPSIAVAFKGILDESGWYSPDYSPWPMDLRLEPVQRMGRSFRTGEAGASVLTRSVRSHEHLRVTAENVDLRSYQVVQPR